VPDETINRPELSGFDPSDDTFLNVRIEFVDLPGEAGNGVRSFWAAGLHFDLCPPKNIVEFTFGIQANIRAKAKAIALLVDLHDARMLLLALQILQPLLLTDAHNTRTILLTLLVDLQHAQRLCIVLQRLRLLVCCRLRLCRPPVWLWGRAILVVEPRERLQNLVTRDAGCGRGALRVMMRLGRLTRCHDESSSATQPSAVEG
jgi:hypothetical protein